MKRLLRGECLVSNTRKFEFDAAFNRKPMQLRQQPAGRTARVAPENNASQRILNPLTST